MYPDIVPSLCCPGHHDCSLLLTDRFRATSDGDVVEGTLVCQQHQRRYPITDGIADLLRWELPNSAAQLTNIFPPTAWGYERIWRHRALTLMTGEPFGYRRELSLVTGLIEPRRTGLYIDSACSNGLYARAIAQARGGAAGQVVGIDHSMAMVRQARAFARRAGLRISYARAKAEALPFGDATATGVAMGGSLNEISEPLAALSEMRRVLGKAGRGVMMSLVQAETSAGRMLQKALVPGGVRFWPLDEHNHMLKTAGLRLVSQWRYQVVVFSSLVSDRERSPRNDMA